MIRLLKTIKRSSILKRSVFGCLRDTPSINITRGCLHSCVYCYARGFSGAPPKGEVHLYQNLPELLEKELSKKRRPPLWISFSTASDAFQDIDEILMTTFSCMKLILERGIGISFLTKGYIPSDFIELFKKYPERVRARIGIVSLDEEYRRLFEPFSAPFVQRLGNVKNLQEAGIKVSVRIDPVIPTITDPEDALEPLFSRLKKLGVKEISVSALVLRPSILEFLRELPSAIRQRIFKLYQGEPWQRVITSARTRLLPRELRNSIYKKFREIGKRYGLNLRICGCKNPDLPWESCIPWVDRPEMSR